VRVQFARQYLDTRKAQVSVAALIGGLSKLPHVPLRTHRAQVGARILKLGTAPILYSLIPDCFGQIELWKSHVLRLLDQDQCHRADLIDVFGAFRTACPHYMKRAGVVDPCSSCCFPPQSETRVLEDERSFKASLPIWPLNPNLNDSLNSVMTCEYLHRDHASYVEQNASLLNQRFPQGKHSTTVASSHGITKHSKSSYMKSA